MKVNLYALAVPVFLLSMTAEWLVARRRGRVAYRFADLITNLGCGISSQVVLVFWAAVQIGLYTAVYEQYRFVDLGSPALVWAAALLFVDFAYYWWHRASHEVNLLWAAHVVHHQSEDYNLAVALRQAVFTSWTGLPFYLPLALLGIPPAVYVTSVALSTLYQFWIHTEFIGKMRGPVEWVFNLPQHHRVHHAINPRYLDKNYGATLIVWDRLFGTFEQETEPPVYGITVPFGSFNPIWAQFQYLVELAQRTRRTPAWADKVRVWFKGPDWLEPGAPKHEAPPLGTRVKYDATVGRVARWYVAGNFVAVLAATPFLMAWGEELPPVLAMGAASAILLALAGLGGVMERKRWAVPVEAIRWVVTAVVLVGVAGLPA